MLGSARLSTGTEPASKSVSQRDSRSRLRLHSGTLRTAGTTNVDALLTKIQDRTAVVGIVGLGYVGLPFAVEMGKVGYRVLGIEQNPERAKRVNAGENYISDVKDEE